MADDNKYLDASGVKVLWKKIKDTFYTKQEGEELSQNLTALSDRIDKIDLEHQTGFSKLQVGDKFVIAQSMGDSLSLEGNGIDIQADPDTKVVTFTANVPKKTSELENDSGFQTAEDVDSAIKSAVASTYTYSGSVKSEDDLPKENVSVGDVYNIETKSSYGPAGMNVAWDGENWDALGAGSVLEPMTSQDVLNAIAEQDAEDKEQSA